MSVRVSIKKASTGLRNKMANGGGLKLQLVGGVEKNERNGKKKKIRKRRGRTKFINKPYISVY